MLSATVINEVRELPKFDENVNEFFAACPDAVKHLSENKWDIAVALVNSLSRKWHDEQKKKGI